MSKRTAVGADKPPAAAAPKDGWQQSSGEEEEFDPVVTDDSSVEEGTEASESESVEEGEELQVLRESGEEGGSSSEGEEAVDRAVADYLVAAAARSRHGAGETGEPASALATEADGGAEGGTAGREGEPSTAPRAVEDSDSSEDEREPRNTVGRVPLVWYKDEDHIGYDRAGTKLLKKGRRDQLDALLARNDSAKEWRTIYDEYNDEEIVLSKDEIRMIQRIREGRFPHVEVNPYEPEADWFTREKEIHPLSSAPEPKRRFIPSKWEEKKVVKLVRALRKGWIRRERDEVPAQAPAYLMWQDDGQVSDKTAVGLSYIPAPKSRLPGHEESYNPPLEYLPTEEEKARYEELEAEERPAVVAARHESLRQVPAYASFIREQFERCLDLYLCPRARKRRLHIADPESLVPQLPAPRDLRPFPTALALRYVGHQGRVLSVAVEGRGQWLASGSADGTVRVWEVATGRCMRTWHWGCPVHSVAWCPAPGLNLLSAACDKDVLLFWAGVGDEEVEAAAAQALQVPTPSTAVDKANAGVTWQAGDDGLVRLVHQHVVRQVTWHARGDYFASTAPTGNTQAVMVHQLSRHATQNPFRKNRGRLVRVLFHPVKPFLFVATQNHIRVYNLAKQALAKKLVGGSGAFTSLAIHPSGDHVIAGSQDKRLAWYDLDLSTKPYKALRYHQQAVRGVDFHRSYPLFASASDDGTVQVFHGMAYQDLLTNPLIVPVKILREHSIVEHEGVLDCAFHPTQPWIFSAGADKSICLFCNP